MSLRMVPGLVSAGLSSQASVTLSSPHPALQGHSHNHPKYIYIYFTASGRPVFWVYRVPLQVFLRHPKECHGHIMDSLLLEDFHDLTHQAAATVFPVWLDDDVGPLGVGPRSWWELDDGSAMWCQSQESFFF